MYQGIEPDRTIDALSRRGLMSDDCWHRMARLNRGVVVEVARRMKR